MLLFDNSLHVSRRHIHVVQVKCYLSVCRQSHPIHTSIALGQHKSSSVEPSSYMHWPAPVLLLHLTMFIIPWLKCTVHGAPRSTVLNLLTYADIGKTHCNNVKLAHVLPLCTKLEIVPSVSVHHKPLLNCKIFPLQEQHLVILTWILKRVGDFLCCLSVIEKSLFLILKICVIWDQYQHISIW